MYFVKYGDEYLHDPRIGLLLPSSQPSVELSTSTEFKFQLVTNHPLYDTIRERDFDNQVVVYQDDVIIYKGEIVDISLDFQLVKEVTCMSDLNYFNGAIVRPYSTLSDECSRTCPTTVEGYFEFLVEEYNKQANDNRKFKIGSNEGILLDSDNYIYRSNTNYPTVGSEINDKILDELGGYLRVRYVGEDSYVDLLSDMPDENAQVIDFGKNLLDFVKDDTSDDVYTFVVPLGKQVEQDADNEYELSLYLPIGSDAITYLQREVTSTLAAKNEAYDAYLEAVESGDQERILEALERYEEALEAYNDAVDAKADADTATLNRRLVDGYYKTDDIIYSDTAVARYGWIGTTASFNDLGTVSELIAYGLAYLKNVESPITTIECTALDLSMLDPDLKPIKLGDYIRVRSKPHNIDSYYLVSAIDYDLNDPSNNTFTLGTTFDTLTGQQNKRINTLNKTINTVYEAADKLSAETKAAAIAAGEAKKEADSAIISIGEEYIVTDDPTTTPDPDDPDWSSTPPTHEEGTYIWNRSTIEYGDESTETNDPVCITGNTGETGEQGPAGPTGPAGADGADGEDGVDGDDGVSVISVTRYYCLAASQPAKPTTLNPGGSWTTTEPQYTSGSTNNLYLVDKTLFSDNTFSYSDVSLSSSYAASKQAYDRAQLAKNELDTYKQTHTLTDTQINTSINGVASDLTELSTTVEGVQEDLDTNYYTKTQVDQTATDIRTEVAEEFENYSTTTQMNSAISQSASSITSSVAATYSTKSEAQGYAEAAVDDLELGGRNLLVLSKSGRYNNPTTANGITISSPDEEGWFTVSGTTTGAGSARALTLWGNGTNAANDFLPREGGTYQLTVEYTAGTFKTGSSWTDSSHIAMYYDTSNKRVAGFNPDTITAEVPNYIYRVAYYIGTDVADGTTINGKFRLKLEKGNKETAWSPASEDVSYTASTQLTQTSSEIRMDFNTSISTAASDLQSQIQAGDALATSKFNEIDRYIRFVDGKIVLGETGNELELTIQNDRVSFTQSGVEVAYFSNNNFYVKQAEILTSLRVGNYEFLPRNDGGLALKQIAEETASLM